MQKKSHLMMEWSRSYSWQIVNLIAGVIVLRDSETKSAPLTHENVQTLAVFKELPQLFPSSP